MPEITQSPTTSEREDVEPIGTLSDATEELLPLFRKLTRECPELAFLDRHQVKFLFDHKRKSSKGKTILGRAKTFPATDKLFHDWEAVITFDLTFWESSPAAREALMHHELCHLAEDKKGGLTTVTHDFADFFVTIERFGDYLNEFCNASSPKVEAVLGIDLERVETM